MVNTKCYQNKQDYLIENKQPYNFQKKDSGQVFFSKLGIHNFHLIFGFKRPLLQKNILKTCIYFTKIY